MRIGELLIACDLITPKQLSAGLEYARAKALPIGRVLKLLRHLDDTGLEMCLLGQRCIRSGMNADIVVAAVKDALASGKPFDEALKANANGMPLMVPQEDHGEAVAVSTVDPAAGKSAADIIRLADDALNEDRLEDAENFYKLGVERFEQTSPADPIQLAYGCSRLAAFYLLTDRWAESETLYLRVLSLREEKLGTDDISIARALTDLADLYDVWDKFDRSVEYALRACSVLQEHLPGSFDEFYGPLRKLTAFAKKLGQAPRRKTGEILLDTGMLSEAKLQLALQQGKQTNRPLGSVLKEDGVIADQDLQSILSAQLLMKEGVLAEEIAMEALKVARKMNMPLRAVIDHFKLLSAATDDDALAELVMEQDRLLAAENGLGVNHPEVAVIAYNLAAKYFQRNALADSELLLKRVLAIDALSAGIPVAIRGQTCELMALIYSQTCRELLAAPLLLRALECLSKAGQTESDRGVKILSMLGDVEMKQKNYASALSFLRSVNALQEKLSAAEEGRIIVLDKLGSCLIETEQLTEAEKVLTKLLSVAEQVYGPTDAETGRCMERLGDVHAWLGSSQQAQALYMRCMQMYEYSLNAAPGASQAVAEKLAKLSV